MSKDNQQNVNSRENFYLRVPNRNRKVTRLVSFFSFFITYLLVDEHTRLQIVCAEISLEVPTSST